MNSSSPLFSRVLIFAIILAFIVVVLGAYTRLSDAGLGCPDWPGCYGKITVPEMVIGDNFERPLEHGKAWKEMIHRYVAGTLGLVILLILWMSIKSKGAFKQPIALPATLVIVVIFQALLGMWTVTMLLSPIIVSAHLLGGLTTLTLLWWLYLDQRSLHMPAPKLLKARFLKVLAGIGFLLVLIQIFLGGWTSSNYAALACGTSFPTCASDWWPTMDFASAFELSHSSGTNYEFGILDSPARTAIQVTHRIGALILAVYLSILGISLLMHSANRTKAAGIALFIVLITQISLGIMNVVFALPLVIAVLHNVIAAVLLLTLITINHKLWR